MFIENASQPDTYTNYIVASAKECGRCHQQTRNGHLHQVALYLLLHMGTNSSLMGPWGTGYLSLIEPEHCTTAIQLCTTKIQLDPWSFVKSKIDSV